MAVDVDFETGLGELKVVRTKSDLTVRAKVWLNKEVADTDKVSDVNIFVYD